MKKEANILQRKILLALVFITVNVFAQCPPNDKFYAITQEAVDNFIIDYPNCTSLQQLNIGDIGPSEWEITDLSPFINLVNVDYFYITGTTTQSLQGLNNLQTVKRFDIYAMPYLLSLEGLDGLESVTGDRFRIGLCLSITNLNGLENLTNINVDDFEIDANTNLNDADGLDCYFFSEEFRNSVTYYKLQESLYPSILENCGINLSNDHFADYNIHIYPNPANSIVNIDNTKHIKLIAVFDLSGRLIKYRNTDFKKIDLTGISTGTYILKISLDSNVIINNKLIIE